MKTYIHYGHEKFDKELLGHCLEKYYDPTKIHREDKPLGLWASPTDAEWGWKDWCECEEFNLDALDTEFTFSLKDSARVLTINKVADAWPFLRNADSMAWFPRKALDFEKIYSNYDAMELNISNDWKLRDINVFYTWDCDSIVVWNPDVVII